MEQLTKIQIIDETVEYYKSHPRSINDVKQCVYKGPNGERCAFSRIMLPERLSTLSEGKNAGYLLDNGIVTDADLMPQYRGHIANFWRCVQQIHDTPTNWDGQTLTWQGVEYVEQIKKTIINQKS